METNHRDVVHEGSTGDSVAGYLAAFAILAGFLSIVYYPGRVGPAAMLVALIACAMATGQRRLAAGALILVTLCWVAGMVLAVWLERPVF
jgi:hypothetical protein